MQGLQLERNYMTYKLGEIDMIWKGERLTV